MRCHIIKKTAHDQRTSWEKTPFSFTEKTRVITETKRLTYSMCWGTWMKTLKNLTEKMKSGVKASGGERNRLRGDKGNENKERQRGKDKRKKETETHLLEIASTPISITQRVVQILSSPNSEEQESLGTLSVCTVHGEPVRHMAGQHRLTALTFTNHPAKGASQFIPSYFSFSIIPTSAMTTIIIKTITPTPPPSSNKTTCPQAEKRKMSIGPRTNK